MAKTSPVVKETFERGRALPANARTLRHVLDGAEGVLWNIDFGVEGTEQFWRPLFFDLEVAQRVLRLEAKTPDDYATLWEESKLPVDREVVRERYFQAIRDREATFSVHYRSRDRHGSTHWLRDHVRVQKTGERSWRFLIVTTDVTHERRASDVVSRTLRVLTHTLDSSRLVLWSADVSLGEEPQWNLCLYNFAAARQLVPLDVQTPDAYVRAWQEALGEEQRADAESRFREALAARDTYFRRTIRLTDSSGTVQTLREDVRIEYHEDERAQVVIVSQSEASVEPCDALADPERTEWRISEERYRALVEHLPVGVYRTDTAGRFQFANPALLRMLRYESFEHLSAATQVWASGQRQELWAHLETEDRILGREETWLTADGSPLEVRENVMTLLSDSGELLGYEGTVENITERQKTFELVRRQAMLDPLTDLPNRSMAQLELEKLIVKASQHHTKVGVLFVDLDKFKEVNDLHGHGLGDRLLVQMARRLQRATRPTDTVARTGGDEFLILAPDILDSDEAQRLASRVRRVVQEPAIIDGQRFELDSSIGTVMYPRDGEDTETLLRHADIAMYHAKSQGGGVKNFTSSMHEEMRERVTLEADLRRAVTEAHELVLHYQPQLDAAGAKVVGVEALVRWNHPERGLLPPAQFIPLAEETGLIIPLGEWVLKEACKQGALWLAAGVPLRMSVNVSPRQFAQRELPRFVARALDESGFPAERLDVELTESTLLEQERMVETSIAALRCLGVGLQIDDFGTGYSSLALLRRYRMDVLKIDRGFIRGIQESAEDVAIVRSVVELAHTLRMVVIAEGVETDWHHECLRDLGCDFLQGYHFSPPVVASEVPSLVERFGGTCQEHH
jgi:diguanylate cyclase (GGDEF)-like protein/PAS domain S-box-containing protein